MDHATLARAPARTGEVKEPPACLTTAPIALCSEFHLKGLLRYCVQPGHATDGTVSTDSTSDLTTQLSATSGYPVIQLSSNTDLQSQGRDPEPPSLTPLASAGPPFL